MHEQVFMMLQQGVTFAIRLSQLSDMKPCKEHVPGPRLLDVAPCTNAVNPLAGPAALRAGRCFHRPAPAGAVHGGPSRRCGRPRWPVWVGELQLGGPIHWVVWEWDIM